MADILKRMAKTGIAVVLVSHDIDFCSENADVCGLLFDGEMTRMQSAGEFFSNNYFYTTDICRMFSDLYGMTAGVGRNLPVNYRQAVEVFER